MNTSNNTLVIDAFWADSKPFPTEISKNSPAGKILYAEYNGTARHLGWMDLVQLRYWVKKHCIKHIELKNLDILGKVALEASRIEVCNFYTNLKNHHIINEFFPELPKNLSYYEPSYHTAVWGGWEQKSDDTELHCRAIQYMKYILIHTPNIVSVSTSTSKVKVTVFRDEHGSPKVETRAIAK